MLMGSIGYLLIFKDFRLFFSWAYNGFGFSTQTTIRISGEEVKYKKQVKYLGVVISHNTDNEDIRRQQI